VLGFIGITDPVFVIAEGLKISEDAAKAAMAKAHDHVNELLATA